MVSDRMSLVLARLDREATGGLEGGVPSAAAVVLGVDGITAGVGIGPSGQVLAWGTEAIGVMLEGLQFTVGEGPAVDAVATGVPVLAPDLAASIGRWPAFTAAAAGLASERGVRVPAADRRDQCGRDDRSPDDGRAAAQGPTHGRSHAGRCGSARTSSAR